MLTSIWLTPAHAKNTLTLVTLDKFEPYSWQEGGVKQGIDIDIVRELCERIHKKCVIQYLPWKRVVSEVKHGKSDGAFSFFITEERKHFVDYTQFPLHASTYKVFVKKGSEFSFRSVQDLFGKVIAKNAGFKTDAAFDLAVKEGKIIIDESAVLETNINKLLKNRVDGVLANYHETRRALVKMNQLDHVVDLPKPINEPRNAYLVLSQKAVIPSREKLISEINLHLKKMHEDGTIDAIHQKYLSKKRSQ
ncbi:substrate-binding periplasmic protein [Algicola sagamiensis]|uniref:substrate-binding periplasmic protein n=1 Tax=Algicola sagamiensis TaxID=163869 RepID=UPI00039A20E8|nr:transporter substrate-binding domain-containing protein [Algicola sagamiensis]